MAAGALLVDTRPVEQRERDGEVPGAVVVDRNVLEWRLDPASPWRIPEVTGYDLEVIVLCNQGYSSSLVADTLRSLGLRRAVDVVGGFEAWAALGLPIVARAHDAAWPDPVTRPRPAAGGGRRLGVAPERLGPWLDGVAERHGAFAEVCSGTATRPGDLRRLDHRGAARPVRLDAGPRPADLASRPPPASRGGRPCCWCGAAGGRWRVRRRRPRRLQGRRTAGPGPDGGRRVVAAAVRAPARQPDRRRRRACRRDRGAGAAAARRRGGRAVHRRRPRPGRRGAGRSAGWRAGRAPPRAAPRRRRAHQGRAAGDAEAVPRRRRRHRRARRPNWQVAEGLPARKRLARTARTGCRRRRQSSDRVSVCCSRDHRPRSRPHRRARPPGARGRLPDRDAHRRERGDRRRRRRLGLRAAGRRPGRAAPRAGRRSRRPAVLRPHRHRRPRPSTSAAGTSATTPATRW